MLTDSRSFLSYPRHEYFRRILCNLLGRDVESGRLPRSEMAWIGRMVEDISYHNAKIISGFDGRVLPKRTADGSDRLANDR